jgi:hypothetical protein
VRGQFRFLKEKDMTESRQLTSAPDALRFALAGNARLTLVSKKTGQRFTYRIRQPVEKTGLKAPPHFVQLLSGPDNTTDYQFFGTIFDRTTFKHSHKARIGATAPSAQAWQWFWPRLVRGSIPTTLEVWHEGRCGRCGRALTVPESIERGIGPECAGIMGIPPTDLGGVGSLPQLELPEFEGPGPGTRGIPARLAMPRSGDGLPPRYFA